MVSTNERKSWETFVRRPGDLREGAELPLALLDLNPGRKKYSVRHVVATVSRNPEEMPHVDTLFVRTVVGVLLPETWGITILRDLPIEVPGKPYHDFFASLKAAARDGDKT